jgi:osmotically-inducible protein OsmY
MSDIPVDDQRIARAAADALAWSRYPALHSISVLVKDGCVTLDGAVDWVFYRGVAESAVRYQPGVRGVENRIKT